MKRQLICSLIGIAFVGLLAGPASAGAPQPKKVIKKGPVPVPEAERKWEICNPQGVPEPKKPVTLAKRIDSFEGKTIGLWWNGKPNGDILLNRVAELLTKRFKDIKVVKFWEVKPETKAFLGGGGRSGEGGPGDAKIHEWMAKSVDLVIASQAD